MRKGKRLIAWIMAVVMLFTICVFDGNGTAEAAATTPVAKHGRLSVKGADLVDSKGNKFQLRGISTHGINWDVGSPYVNKKAFKTLRDDWGVNAIRLAMYTEEYNGYWKDVGTLGSYWESNMELIDLIPVFNLYEEFWKIYTKSDQIGRASCRERV